MKDFIKELKQLSQKYKNETIKSIGFILLFFSFFLYIGITTNILNVLLFAGFFFSSMIITIAYLNTTKEKITTKEPTKEPITNEEFDITDH